MRRNFTPKLDGLEPKLLMSGLRTLLSESTALPVPSVAPPTASTPPFVPGQGQPTPFEIAKEQFVASFSGQFSFTPARYTSESERIDFLGKGISNQFLKGNYLMVIAMPNTPGGPIRGGAYLQDNNLNGSTAIGLDINFDPNSLDARGRPTLGAWSTDPNVYSGPDFVALGKGTVSIRYGHNNATVIFKGLMFRNGITNPLANRN